MYPKDTTKEGKEGIDKGLLQEVLGRSFSLSWQSGRLANLEPGKAKGWHSISCDTCMASWYIKQAGTIQVGCRPVQLVLKVTLVHCWLDKVAGKCPTFVTYVFYGKCETYAHNVKQFAFRETFMDHQWDSFLRPLCCFILAESESHQLL